jgi:hypothetical protein
MPVAAEYAVIKRWVQRFLVTNCSLICYLKKQKIVMELTLVPKGGGECYRDAAALLIAVLGRGK